MYYIPTPHCTMGLSIGLRLRFGSILIEPIWSCLGQVKNCPKQISPKYCHSQTHQKLTIQLDPNNWNTSFHQPDKNSIDSLPNVASFQLVPKYISTVKGLSKYFTVKQLFPWKIGAKGQIYLMLLFNGDRPIVHWRKIKEQNSVGISLKIIKH